MTSDHTIVLSNQISDPVTLVLEHTVCVGRGLIRGHFRMAPQPGWGCCFESSFDFNTYLVTEAVHVLLLELQEVESLEEEFANDASGEPRFLC